MKVLPRSVSRFALLAIVFVGVAGCGGGEKVVSVSGIATHKGQPLPGLVISFVPELKTETGVSTGETDENGRYSLTVVTTRASGAVVGKHKVWVSLPREPFVEKDAAADEQAREERVKAKKPKPKPSEQAQANLAEVLKTYGRLDSSPMVVEVKDGSPIDLKFD